jgi:GAF domain-containing protein
MADSTTTFSFPFRSVLNLRLLVEYWEQSIQQGNIPAFAQSIQDYINQAPELKQPIENTTILDKHRTFIDFLMTAVIPPANTEKELAAAILPFQFKALYSTQAFARTINLDGLESRPVTNIAGQGVSTGKTIKACLMIMEKFYGVKNLYDRPILLTLPDIHTGLDKVYKVEINHQFCEIISRSGQEPIDKHVIKFLLEKVYDIDLWLQYLRPENYEFHGFLVMRLVDVTEQEMLSSIKYDLLKKNAVMDRESFLRIQYKLRSLFGISNMRLGIAYIGPNNNLILNNGAPDCWKSLTEQQNDMCDGYDGSIYEVSWKEKRSLTIENLADYPFKSKIEKALLANNINNILLAPLVDEGETIGMLELAAATPGVLNSDSAHRVEHVLPMFTAAVKRVKEEMSTEVRALIQEECTAIHPSVQWRFFEAGVNLMNKRRVDQKAVLEEIVFKEIYPLYGLADVRNSSTERNSAIQKDLQHNLKLAKELLQTIYTRKRFPTLAEVIFKTEKQLHQITTTLASGDESSVLEFLKTEIHPLLQHFEREKDLREAITSYRSQLDPVFGVVYNHRKDFEESLALINTTISHYLDDAEESAQQMFPHYFEKYKTDGIEHTLYVGSSMTKDKIFDPFYLKNFRLWQLLTMVEITKKADALKPKLKNNLDIAQLLLVHDQPISIRFRPDEKQFDVDGAYDIRYEIVKKRIDKAYIKDSGERLTQPGKIAIVYNQAKVQDEYKQYFHYLASKRLIADDVEDLELEELPGATGLRALRIQVLKEQKQIPTMAMAQEDLLKDIEEGLGLRMH